MIKLNSLSGFITHLLTFDPSVEVFEFFSKDQADQKIAVPPVGKLLARREEFGYSTILIFTTTGALVDVLYAGRKGNFFAVQSGFPYVPAVPGPIVEKLVHDSPAALQKYLITKQADNVVEIYPSESSVNAVGAYRFVTHPGKYYAIKGTQPAALLRIAAYGKGKFLTEFK